MMKRRYIAFIIIMTLFLSGCSSYEDINATIFCTMIIVDVDENDKPVLYLECFRSLYSQDSAGEKGVRFILTGTGDTILEAIENMNECASYRLNLVQNKIIVFTEKVAKLGLNNYMDVFIRDQEFLLRPYILIYDGDPKKILEVVIKQEEFIGLYIDEVVLNDIVGVTKKPYQLFEYANFRIFGTNTAVIGMLTIEENIEPQLCINEAAVLKDDKMVSKLTDAEYKLYNFLNGKSDNAIITVPNPEDDQSLVTMHILNGKVKTSIQYNGKNEEVVHYKKEFNLQLSFGETHKQIDLEDPKIREKLAEEVKEKLMKEVEALFKKYKTQNIDIFEVEEAFLRKYPQYDMIDVVEKTIIEVDVKAKLEGSPDTQNYEE